MRLIDADALDDEVMHLFIAITGNPKQSTVVNECKSSFRNMIEEQPTVGEWIPVQENAYPKEKGWYQCTCDDRKVGEQIWPNHTIVRDLFWNSSRKEFVDNVRYSENGHKDIEKYFWTKYVTAWRPLPEPYQTEGGTL